MKVLVCITNNLRYDTRVKRHIRAIAERADSVHVLIPDTPDGKLWLDLPNVSHSFVNITRDTHPVTESLRLLCEKLDILPEMQEIAPVLYSDTYFQKDEAKRLLDLQNFLFASERWADVRAGIPEECTDVEQIATWLWILETMIKWAEAAANIFADVIYCNDTETLLCGVAHKKKYGSRLIYDVHDIFYDIAPGEFCRAQRYCIAMIENQGIRYADAVLGISNQYLKTLENIHGYNGPLVFMPNCTPPQSEPRDCRVKKEMMEPLRFYYHGMITAVRGIDKVILALHSVPDAVLMLRCFQTPYVEDLKELVKQESLCERVKFLEVVPIENILNATTNDADVGLAFWDNGGQARLSLALRGLLNNKFIEYLTAGIPVLTMAGTEQGDIVEEYQCGAVGECTVEDIAKKMKWFCENRAQYAQMSQNALQASSELFVWDKYKPLLQQIVCTTESSAPNNQSMEERYLWEEKRLWQELYYTKGSDRVVELEQNCQQLEQRNRELEQHCQQLEQRNRELEQNCQQPEQRNRELEQHCQQLEQRNRELEQNCQQSEQRNRELEQQYQNVLNSKRWKITKPLHVLSCLLKGIQSRRGEKHIDE